MRENLSEEDTLALNVVAARKDLNAAIQARLEADAEAVRARNVENDAATHLRELREEFDKAMEGSGP